MCCPEGMRTVVNYHTECPNTDCGVEEMAWRQLTTIVVKSADGEKQIQEFDVERAVCVLCVCVCGGGGDRGGEEV